VVGGFPAMVVAWAIVGLGTSFIVIPWFTYRQDIVAPEVIGRVVSVSRAVSYLTMPFGALVGSWVLTGAGTATLFAVAAACQAVVWIGTAASPLARARQEPAADPAPSTAADTAGASPSG
jgi:predicted MFS family arabinose efflux permease